MSKKALYFHKVLNHIVTAAAEDGKLVNCDIEKQDGSARAGNIYKGVIKSVLDGMQAAFVDCGLQRNCYLSADDVCPYGQVKTDIKNLLKEGNEVIVQVVKPPAGKKGAKVTTHLSFVGKSSIFLPQSDFVGVSNKIEDGELRASLTLEAENARQKGEGVVIRSAAPFFTYGHITKELDYLKKQYRLMLDNAKNVDKGLIYSDGSLPGRILRDNNTEDVEKIVVDDEELLNKVNDILTLVPHSARITAELYAGKRDMLEEYGIARQIYAALSPAVPLDGGANLVIQRTEALTVIDVNTGKFVGDDNYEQTVYQTNLTAAREIARQVQLRNIGGIVVVDFIDMKAEKHRKALTYELREALQGDAAQCKVLPMSEFGLIQFTRRRTGKGIGDVMLAPCKRCGGNGFTLADDALLVKVRAEILRVLDEGATGVLVQTDSETAANMLERKDFIEDLREKFPAAEIKVKADGAYAKGEFLCKPCTCRPADAATLY